jgi:hypothetical protein
VPLYRSEHIDKSLSPDQRSSSSFPLFSLLSPLSSPSISPSHTHLDPYFEIAIAHKGIRPVLLYRSEHIDKSLSPVWQPAEIALLDIGNPYFPLTVSVYDFDKDGGHDLIGECVLTLDECILGNLTLPIINHSKKGKYVLSTFFPLFLFCKIFYYCSMALERLEVSTLSTKMEVINLLPILSTHTQNKQNRKKINKGRGKKRESALFLILKRSFGCFFFLLLYQFCFMSFFKIELNYIYAHISI